MKFLTVKFFIFTCLFNLDTAEPKLKSLNVIFRHGDRTPTRNSMFPTDPNFNSNFYPYGAGALTNQGKSRIYKFGELLRDRYKNDLGDVYLPEFLYARCSDYDRTKMSLQLVLSALFPPSEVQKWHDELNWQPIPFIYQTKKDDDLLTAIYQPKFISERKRVESEPDIKNLTANFSQLMQELSELTGKPIHNCFLMKSVYDTLVAESYMNLTLPAWAKEIFPKGKLHDAALLDYDIMTHDISITKALVGSLVTKITKDILISFFERETLKTKLFLYSAHDANVAGVLRALKIYKTHVPEYTSGVVIEFIEDNHQHYVKILYYQGIPSKFLELQMPGCPVLCPIDQYLSIIHDVIEFDIN